MFDLVPGRYERVVDRGLAEVLEHFVGKVDLREVSQGEAADLLVQFLVPHLRRAISASMGEAVEPAWELASRLVELLSEAQGGAVDQGDLPGDVPRVLKAVAPVHSVLAQDPFPAETAIPLSLTELLVNARGELGLGKVLQTELASADSVDLLCSFLKWSGFRLLREDLQAVRERGGRLRVLTTAYCGATDAKVLDALQGLGAEVRVSLDTRRTRLHAKAWLLNRDSGYSTALIGSSNLSAAALTDGLEWNVRFSNIENPAILERYSATFESYWEDREFQDWGEEGVREAFLREVNRQRFDVVEPEVLSGLDLKPYPFQEEILERLAVARKVHGRHRNLIVAATGTGKTLVAAFDYRRLCEEARRELPGSGRPSLLFIAHRREILEQSRRAFREVLKDAAFGELYVGGNRPQEGKHVFASVQSLSRLRLETLRPGEFGVVMVDEFHHAEAPTYRRVLDYLRPQELLGLTATPERTDGRWVQDTFFDGRITAEIRLWDALERGLLCPFQYFGIADDVDLSRVAWSRSGYDVEALSQVLTGNQVRVRLVHRQIQEKLADPRTMRALGFCVSVAHAEYMAREFEKLGYRCRAVSGSTDREERRAALQDLRQGQLQVVFSVDLLNEGVDLPEVDTLLLLRPTQSAILFQQKLGRGLRLAEGKENLTVLDFIGQAHRQYSWAANFRAISGGSAGRVESMVAEGFPSLPPGCSIQLDRQAQEYVLENIRQSTRDTWRWLAEEVRRLGQDVSLPTFLEQEQLQVEEIYAKPGKTWSKLRADARLGPVPPASPAWRAVARLRHVDDPDLLRSWAELVSAVTAGREAPDGKRARMLAATLLRNRGEDWEEELLELLRGDALLSEEILQLSSGLLAQVSHEPLPLPGKPGIPLSVHCRYSLDQIMAAFGISGRVQAGVYWHQPTDTDLFFVTLQKEEGQYSPRTMYRDFAISPEVFHWESQNLTRAASATGRRYQEQRPLHRQPLLFLRTAKKGQGGMTEPYFLAGPLQYMSHRGERPMAITWRLAQPLPGDWFRLARQAAG